MKPLAISLTALLLLGAGLAPSAVAAPSAEERPALLIDAKILRFADGVLHVTELDEKKSRRALKLSRKAALRHVERPIYLGGALSPKLAETLVGSEVTLTVIQDDRGFFIATGLEPRLDIEKKTPRLAD